MTIKDGIFQNETCSVVVDGARAKAWNDNFIASLAHFWPERKTKSGRVRKSHLASLDDHPHIDAFADTITEIVLDSAWSARPHPRYFEGWIQITYGDIDGCGPIFYVKLDDESIANIRSAFYTGNVGKCVPFKVEFECPKCVIKN